MQQSFTFNGLPKLIFGPGSINRLKDSAALLGRRALLVTGAGSLERSGQLERIERQLRSAGVDMIQCRITGEPSPAVVDRVADRYKGESIDGVLAVGGGSVLDAGKAIAAMLMEPGTVIDYLEGVGTKRPSGRSLPVIAVPTTSGTGSEATKNAVISQPGSDGFKKSLRHDNYIPKLAILDAVLCATAPPALTAACGMDALTQLIESYISTQASPLTDALAWEGLAHLVPALPLVCGMDAADIDSRGAMAYAAFLSGVTLAHAGLGVVHGVAGPMGGMLVIPHGVACANLLPFAVMATIENLTAENTAATKAAITKLAHIGRRFGSPHEDPLDCCSHLVDRLGEWLDQLAIPRLGPFGMTPRLAHRLAQHADNKNNPMPLSVAQIERMILARC